MTCAEFVGRARRGEECVLGLPVRTAASAGVQLKMPAAAVILTISPGMKGATAMVHVTEALW